MYVLFNKGRKTHNCTQRRPNASSRVYTLLDGKLLKIKKNRNSLTEEQEGKRPIRGRGLQGTEDMKAG